VNSSVSCEEKDEGASASEYRPYNSALVAEFFAKEVGHEVEGVRGFGELEVIPESAGEGFEDDKLVGSFLPAGLLPNRTWTKSQACSQPILAYTPHGIPPESRGSNSRRPDSRDYFRLASTHPESGLRPSVQMDRSVVIDSRMGVRYPSAGSQMEILD
jgi:hypothetical protein